MILDKVFYGVLVQHFANLAGAVPPPMDALDILTRQLLDLTPVVPLYAATIALARLSKLQERLSASLSSDAGKRVLILRIHVQDYQ